MTRLFRALAILLPTVAARSGPRPAAEARADILRIQAGSCAGESQNRVGTGFAWRSAKEVVTALHVVAGCQQVMVYSERNQQSYRASVARVLRRADLALVQ